MICAMIYIIRMISLFFCCVPLKMNYFAWHTFQLIDTHHFCFVFCKQYKCIATDPSAPIPNLELSFLFFPTKMDQFTFTLIDIHVHSQFISLLIFSCSLSRFYSALFTHLVWVIQNFWNCIFIILLALLKFKIERMSVLLESSLKLNCYLEWWLFICCQINPDTVILPTLPGHTYLLLFISSTSSTLSLPSNIYIAFSFLYSSCNKTTIFPLRYCTAFFSHPFREVPHFPLLSSFPIFVPQTQRYSVITI